jgi:hypothetical protein
MAKFWFAGTEGKYGAKSMSRCSLESRLHDIYGQV